MADNSHSTAKKRAEAKKLSTRRSESMAKKQAAAKATEEQARKDALVRAPGQDVDKDGDLPPLPKDRELTQHEMRLRQRHINHTIRDVNRAAATAAAKAVHDTLSGRKGRDVHSRLQRRDAVADLMHKHEREVAAAAAAAAQQK